MSKRKIASDLSKQAYSDTTKYQAMEVAHAFVEGLQKGLDECIEKHKTQIDSWEKNEICVVYVVGTDPLIKNLKRRKFYCWPYLPSPRPYQTVFLYSKSKGRIVKRLWTLPVAESMAILATPGLVVDKPYKDMQRWSFSFFKGSFWKDIRKEHDINMLSQEEFDELNRDELVKAGLEDTDPDFSEPFDFSKINPLDVGDPNKPVALQNA